MSLSVVVLKILPPKSEEGRTSPYQTIYQPIYQGVVDEAPPPPPPVVYVPMEQGTVQASDGGQSEFAQLKQTLVVGTLLVALGLTVVVTLVWSLHTGLSFGLGGAVSALYLRLLAKSVEGNTSGGWRLPLGSVRMVVFIGLMVVALKTDALAVLPAFLGFLTYKVFLLVYAIRLASKS